MNTYNVYFFLFSRTNIYDKVSRFCPLTRFSLNIVFNSVHGQKCCINQVELRRDLCVISAAHVPEYPGCLVHFLLKHLNCLLRITCTDDDLEEDLSETEAPKVKKKKKAKKSSRESKSSKRQRSRREVGLTDFTPFFFCKPFV